MRAIQLKCYHSGREAEGKDRDRILSSIARLQSELERERDQTEQIFLRHRIGVLKGDFAPPRS